jgi:hypothetical protein
VATVLLEAVEGSPEAEVPSALMARLRVEPETRWMFNQKPAKALGLTIPQPLMLRADKVIE